MERRGGRKGVTQKARGDGQGGRTDQRSVISKLLVVTMRLIRARAYMLLKRF
jgi:hypothetical protein